jgi:glyoxylase-like metal-dependent hydrolase (beta-lactamase superfamily II)
MHCIHAALGAKLVPVVLSMASTLASAAPPCSQGHLGTSCPAGDARLNTRLPYEVGCDFVPLTSDASLYFHVIYSAKCGTGGSTVVNNSSIFVLPLLGNEVLIFGGGYGNAPGTGGALNDAAYDVANVDAVLRDCLGLVPTNTVLRLVAPHGHGDHVSSAFLHELESAGYTVRDITFHEGDAAAIQRMTGWLSADRARFVALAGGGPCGAELQNFSSTLGKIWFVERAGHTPGSIDLVIDVAGNPNDRVLVLGSAPGGNCRTPPPGTRTTIQAHGNVLLPRPGV